VVGIVTGLCEKPGRDGPLIDMISAMKSTYGCPSFRQA